MKIRAAGCNIRIRAIRPSTDVERARVRERIGVALEAVERVGARGAAVLRVEGEGRPGTVGRHTAFLHLRGRDSGRATDGVAGGAVNGDAGWVAALCVVERSGHVNGVFASEKGGREARRMI